MKNTDKNFFRLLLILISLIVLFIISLIKPDSAKKNTTMTTALVNTKYDISKIIISSNTSGELSLYNFVDFWGGRFFNGSNYVYFPVDEDKIKSFLELSKQIQELDKIVSAKSKEQLDTYDVTENSLTVSYFDNTDNCVSKINFGAMNQTMDKIFLSTEKNMTVYAIDSKIAYYLECSVNFWADKNLIPQGISNGLNAFSIQNFDFNLNGQGIKKASDVAFEKFPSYRFSEIETNFELEDKELEIKITDGKGTSYTYNFFPAKTINGNCYIFNLNISPSIVFSDLQKDFIKKLNYSASISQWTFNSIKELL